MTELEKDISDVLKYAPPAVRNAGLPDRVEYNDGTVSKLSAEAIMREFEVTAKEVEAMGKELADIARRCEATVAGAHQALAECKETAALIRDKGKHYSAQIADVSAMTAEVRATCSALKAKIAGPGATA